MAANINDYVSKARQDLHDPNPPAAIWSDADLQRHALHAVAEYQLWRPLEVKVTSFSLTAGSRDLDITSIAPALFGAGVLAVEYPTAQWPPTYVQFQRFANTLTLFLDGAPLASDQLAVNLYTLQVHTVSTSACTIAPADDEAVIAGTVHFAATEYALEAAGMLNVAGPQTWQRYRDLAVDKGNEFRGYLDVYRAVVRSQRAYAPQEPRQSRYTVEAPWRD